MPITIKIPSTETWDPVKEEFETVKGQKIVLEHSLLSISKWEAKWKKSFLSSKNKTEEEMLDYIRCMTLTQNVEEKVYRAIPYAEIFRIKDYIDDPMTATTFREDGRPPSRKIVTTEEIYFQMCQLGIPFSCEKWHLNRLLTLIRVGSIMSQDPKMMPRSKVMSSNAQLNAMRRKQLGSRG